MRAADAFRVAWYRFRCTLSRRWTGYLAITLLLGLVGGLAMGSVAAARRTQGAYLTYLAATNPSDLTVLTGLSGPSGAPGYDPAVIQKIAALPAVRHVASYSGLNVAILGVDGEPVPAPYIGGPLPGSLDGEYFTTDRATAVEGRLPDPSRPDEIAIDAKGTPGSVRVGTVAELGFYTNAQLVELYAGKHVTPAARQRVTVVGAVVYSAEETQDDIDTQRDGGALFTPALTRKLIGCCADFTETAVQLRPGTKVPDVEAAIQGVLPAGFPIEFYDASLTVAKAQRAIAPTSIALAVFGGIAALAALIIAGQVIGRQLRRDTADLATMRALGAGPAVTTADGMPGVLAAIALGALLAAAVAVALSPLAPLGAIRVVYPTPGVALDWITLGGGIAVIIAIMSGAALVIARRRVPRAPDAGVRPYRPLGVRAVRAAQALGLPVPATEGVRLAFGPGTDRDQVTVAPAILGTVLASVVMMATITFGSSLTTLVSHPALYGWNWTFDLSSGNTGGTVAGAAPVLDSDPAVAAWTGVWYATASIEGQAVPVLGMTLGSPIAPPLLSGHGLRAPDEVVLGAATLAALHKQVGDWVTVQDGGPAKFRLRIAGTATLPSLGVSGTLHTEMGTGAVLDYQHIPGVTANEPNEVLVTLRPGADVAAALTRWQPIVPPQNGGVIAGVQRPAEITDYRSMGAAPLILAGALAAGAVASLWLTLAASVRRRRADLALLKTLGLTRRQLAATVAWQSTVAVAAGALVGVPLGIALGRYLWDLFARQISVIPQPSVPVLTVVAVIAGALAAANLVAAIPGRAAAKTPAAALLRAE
ncbi:ABC transporter permease [Trebonia kvetii]|uniref:ABC transporter permease n=1 Tax=Trebonia kvetii TaxID=2480626 RepID=A0A6P2C2S7_9ACTN|nr:FtsX-like permease family protein [Trebonia kvetii]TVZ05470.1 ABC transporter permease [Trebonia kvetii]